MTEEFTIAEVNCATGEQTVRPMTQDEIDQLLAVRADWAARQAAQEAEAAAKAADKASAEAKLAALGLTAEEISALTK